MLGDRQRRFVPGDVHVPRTFGGGGLVFVGGDQRPGADRRQEMPVGGVRVRQDGRTSSGADIMACRTPVGRPASARQWGQVGCKTATYRTPGEGVDRRKTLLGMCGVVNQEDERAAGSELRGQLHQFAMKISNDAGSLDDTHFKILRGHGFSDEDMWDICATA